MTPQAQIITDHCPEAEPVDGGVLCMDGNRAGKTVSYGTCRACLLRLGIKIELTKSKTNKPVKHKPCTNCRGI